MKTLNLKKWLKSQGIDTKLFWENCKMKNQKWDYELDYHKRSELRNKPTHQWIGYAFQWYDAPQGHNFWEEIDTKWKQAVDKYISNNSNELHKIEFGFGRE